MTVLRDGQMNALIIPNCDSEDFSFVSVDDFPKKKALNSQNADDMSMVSVGIGAISN